MSAAITIRPATEGDVPSIARIHNYYIANTTASYEEVTSTEEQVREKVKGVMASFPYLVAASAEGEVVGFAYADRFRKQSGWKLAESTVYVDHEFLGQGIGKRLYERLIDELRAKDGIIGIVAMIALDNPESIAFHEAKGFKLAGKWERCARKFGKWLGAGSWVLMFDDSSQG